MVIPPIAPIAPLAPITSTSLENTPKVSYGDGAQKTAVDFSKFLNDALSQVNDLQVKADTANLGLVSGRAEELAAVTIALEKANLSLSLTVSARDKLLDAYNQIMRMQM